MSWFGGERRGASQRPAAAEPAPPAEEALAAPQHSLGLRAVFERLALEDRTLDQRPWILDLGPALGSNVALLAEMGCRLHVADLYDALAETDPARADPERDFAALAAGELPPAGDFEAVLAWDLFNYFTPAQLRGVAAALARCCRPGALLFALISIHKQIPPRPLRYRIVGRDRLLYEGDAATTRPGPRYHQPELERALPGFRVDTSYLLRHGVQEYLFVRG